MSKLPEGWVSVELSALTSPSRPRCLPSNFPQLPFIGMEQVEAQTRKLLGTVPASTMKSTAFHFFKGDVLYGRLRPYLNKVYCAEFEGLCSSEFIVLSSSSAVSSKYLHYYLNTESFAAFANQLNQGDRPRVSFDQIESHHIPLPPYSEQYRIVAKLEKLLSRVDVAQVRLATIPLILKRFRQAVLNAAFSGKLTADWRSSDSESESAEFLLKEVKLIKELLVNTKQIKKENPLPAITNGDEFGMIPDTWELTRLGDICSHVSDIDHKMPKSVSSGVKFLSAKDLLDDGTLNLTHEIKRISEADYTRLSRKIKPQRDDIIYSRIGARLGKARLVATDEKFLVSYSCCVIRPILISPLYLTRYLDSAAVLARAMEDSQSIGVPDLGIQKIKEFVVPIPPHEEQQEVVRRVEALFKVADQLEARYLKAKAHVDKLTQSILAKAFRGELVPTEAELARQEGRDYETAANLLERIRQERSPHKNSNKPTRNSRKKQDTATRKMFA